MSDNEPTAEPETQGTPVASSGEDSVEQLREQLAAANEKIAKLEAELKEVCCVIMFWRLLNYN